MARVLYLSGARVPSTKASAVQTVRMCDALTALGHDVVLVCARAAVADEDPLERYGVRPFDVRAVPRPSYPVVGTLVFVIAALLEARGTRPDLVVVSDRFLAAVVRVGAPVVRELHELPVGWQRSLERVVLARRDLSRVVTSCRELARDYAALFPSWRGPVVVAHNAAAPTEPRAPSPSRDRPLRVGYVGHTYPDKGHDVLTTLARLFPQVEAHLVAATQDEAAAARQSTGDVVNLRVRDPVEPREVPALLEELDVVLLPTRPTRVTHGHATPTYPSPLKLFEYMMAGRAIIASDLTALREVLRHEENALLVPHDDVAAWETALRRLLNDEALRGRLGARAREDALSLHTWSRRAALVVEDLLAQATAS